MNVYYDSRKLQKLCDSTKEAQRQLGQPTAKKLSLMLAQLMAASCLADIPITPPPRLHQLKRGAAEEFAVMLHGGDRLVFRVGEPVPRLPDGGVDKGLVQTVVITFVGDYHD